MAGWITVSNWHLTKSLAEGSARGMRKRYKNDKFRVVSRIGKWCVQVWDTSFKNSGAYDRKR